MSLHAVWGELMAPLPDRAVMDSMIRLLQTVVKCVKRVFHMACVARAG